ncbi:MAG: hypothetical protein J7513_08980 [Solirubrobacteraceae bacterium]|nr:hypothetical protein [Solirubrobacteraceae bacterium]
MPTHGIAPIDPYAQPYADARAQLTPPHQSQYAMNDPYAPRRTQPAPPQADPAPQPQQAYSAPDPHAQQPYAAPDPYAPPQPPYPDPSAYGQPPQPYVDPAAYPGPYVPQPAPAPVHQPVLSPYVAQAPPQAPPAPYPAHVAYADRSDGRPPMGPPPGDGERKSAWNKWSYGLIAIAVVVLAVLGAAQLKARKAEASVKPLVVALSQRNASARCPRYITSVLTNVGSVRLDSEGRIADRTDLTGPVCDGLRNLYKPGGTAELACLTNGGKCSRNALISVVSISVVAHESMHLRGQLDEGRAECESIGESEAISRTLKIPLQQARVISYLHYAGMNPYTPDRYQVSASNCAPVAALEADLPGDPAILDRLRVQTSNTWRELAT